MAWGGPAMTAEQLLTVALRGAGGLGAQRVMQSRPRASGPRCGSVEALAEKQRPTNPARHKTSKQNQNK